MSLASRITFNLLFNSMSSFLIAAVIVVSCTTLFRIRASRLKLFLLSLPFLKILWETCRGIPPHSFVYSGGDAFLIPRLGQWLYVGAGFFFTGPQFNVALAVPKGPGQEWNISAAEYVWGYLAHHVFAGFPSLLLLVFFSVSLFLLFQRWRAFFSFERTRKADEKEARCKGGVRETRVIRRKEVIVYLSDRYRGTPFTGGFFRPYICIPRTTYECLLPEEYESVLQHELSHIRRYDLWLTFLIQTLGDAFWFIPGYRFLSRRIDRLREILADEDAVRAGAQSEFLASALVKLPPLDVPTAQPILYSAFFRERSILKERVGRLLGGQENRSIWLWRQWWARWIIGFWSAGSVFISTLGGNYAPKHMEYSKWLDYFIRHILGICIGCG